MSNLAGRSGLQKKFYSNDAWTPITAPADFAKVIARRSATSGFLHF
jgi:hypothetical protein